MLYRPWRNHEGQMTLFQQILRNPDVFNFGDHHHHAVAMEVSFGKTNFFATIFSKMQKIIYIFKFSGAQAPAREHGQPRALLLEEPGTHRHSARLGRVWS